MKKTHAILLLLPATLIAQLPAPKVPDDLKPAFEILQRTYQRLSPQKFPKAPADSVWLFQSTTGTVGSVDVAFQGSEIVYMVFHRGVGGTKWTKAEVQALHETYSSELLKEEHLEQKYTRAIILQINAAVISKKGFDTKALSGSL